MQLIFFLIKSDFLIRKNEEYGLVALEVAHFVGLLSKEVRRKRWCFRHFNRTD